MPKMGHYFANQQQTTHQHASNIKFATCLVLYAHMTMCENGFARRTLGASEEEHAPSTLGPLP